MDKLTISGVGHRLDGEYPCDIAGLIDVSSDEALTVAEAHWIKTFSGARGGEIVEAFLAGDMAVRSALAYVILTRAGKRVEEEMIWRASSAWARFELGTEAPEVSASENPTTEDAPPEKPETNGGESSPSTSEIPADVLRAIGARV